MRTHLLKLTSLIGLFSIFTLVSTPAWSEDKISQQRLQELCGGIKSINVGKYGCIKRFPDLKEQVERIYSISTISNVEKFCPNIQMTSEQLEQELVKARFPNLDEEEGRKVCTEDFQEALRLGEKLYQYEIGVLLKDDTAK